MPAVSWVHRDLMARRTQYETIRDCIEGQHAVKHRKTKYLPMPNAQDTSDANVKRYMAYLTRANFYGVTGRTRRGLVGQIFARSPEVVVPDVLSFTEADMSGLGVNFTQQAKTVCGETIAIGRCGLLSDFPTLLDGVTQDQINNGTVAPTILDFQSERIINWRYESDKGRRFYTLIVIEEEREVVGNDFFSVTKQKQWRVLRLDASGNYVQEIYYDDKTASVQTLRPTRADGTPFPYIPFEFIGSEDNDCKPDSPPLYDLAEINLAHYRNSADYEELCFLVGQPTPVFSGLTQQWVDENFAGGKVYLGSTAAVPMPAGGRAELLQASPNQLAAEAMAAKERRMVALGAKLVEQRQVQRTATEAGQEEAAESSVLSTIADNVSVAYAQAFATAGEFVRMGSNVGITIKLNTSFEVANVDPATRAQIIKEWQSEAITFEEMRSALRKAGVATVPDNEALEAIQEEVRKRAELDPTELEEPAGNGGDE